MNDIESPRRTLIRRLITGAVIVACIAGLAVAVQHAYDFDRTATRDQISCGSRPAMLYVLGG